MSLFTWTDQYRVHTQEIDAEHKELFRLGETLYAAVLSGQPKPVQEARLEEFLAFSKMHFASEERLMKQTSYGGYLKHKAQHSGLLKEATQFQTGFVAGQYPLKVDMIKMFREWLGHHIGDSDRKMGEHLATQLAGKT